MKSEKNICIAFILNLSFAIFEFIGGAITGSVAIISDSVHDIGDALSIGLSYLLERKSSKAPDENYTYGYKRYSVIGSVITTSILLVGSLIVIYNAFQVILNPVQINYNGMIVFALIGSLVNFFSAYFTKDGDSLNQKAVNLHMLEDVLGWLVVLLGAIVMRFTNLAIIDPLLSILVAMFILINAFKNLKEVIYLFLEKTPQKINVKELKEHLLGIKGVNDVHHIHLWSIDGTINCATMHIVTNVNYKKLKDNIRLELKKHDIQHVTIEMESLDERCEQTECEAHKKNKGKHHHHH